MNACDVMLFSEVLYMEDLVLPVISTNLILVMATEL
jgi:hypothetical protein